MAAAPRRKVPATLSPGPEEWSPEGTPQVAAEEDAASAPPPTSPKRGEVSANCQVGDARTWRTFRAALWVAVVLAVLWMTAHIYTWAAVHGLHRVWALVPSAAAAAAVYLAWRL